MKPKFLLDEHLKRAIQEQLNEMRVQLIGDEGVPPLATPDSDILRWIECNNYLLVTCNRATMPRHLTEHLQAGGHVPGILCFPQQTPIGTFVKELRRIWKSFEPDQYQNIMQYLPQKKR